MTPERLKEIEERLHSEGRHWPGLYSQDMPDLCAALREAWAEIKELNYHLETCKSETEHLL